MNLGSGFWACWYRGQKIIFITYWRLPLTYLLIVFFLRYACAIPIPENDTVILTGGYTTRRTVAVYNENGWQRNLPNLLTERMYFHGCTSFVSGNKRVDIFYKFYMGCITFILWLFQIQWPMLLKIWGCLRLTLRILSLGVKIIPSPPEPGKKGDDWWWFSWYHNWHSS